MEKIRLAVIYYSTTGTNFKLAKWAASAAAQDAECKLFKIEEKASESDIAKNPAWKAHVEEAKDVDIATLDTLEWADAIIFSMPTRYGNLPAQMKQFIDSTGSLWFNGKLANKVVSAMTSAQNPHGGQEATLLAFYTSMFHWGAIIAAPGYTSPAVFAAGGNPYGTSATANGEPLSDEIRAAVEHQTERTVMIANWVKNGLTKSNQ